MRQALKLGKIANTVRAISVWYSLSVGDHWRSRSIRFLSVASLSDNGGERKYNGCLLIDSWLFQV